MSKRFSETDKWYKDRWFSELNKNEKLLFLFLCDSCDMAGFYEFSPKHVALATDLTIAEAKQALEGLNKSVLYNDGVVWLKNFLKNQKNIPINYDNNCHKAIVRAFISRSNTFPEAYEYMLSVLVDRNSIPESEYANASLIFSPKVAPTEGLRSPMGRDKDKGNDKGNDNEAETIPTESEAPKSKPKKLNPTYEALTEGDKIKWNKVRDLIKECLHLGLNKPMFELYGELSKEYGEENVIEAVKQAAIYGKKSLNYVKGILKGMREKGTLKGQASDPLEKQKKRVLSFTERQMLQAYKQGEANS